MKYDDDNIGNVDDIVDVTVLVDDDDHVTIDYTSSLLPLHPLIPSPLGMTSKPSAHLIKPSADASATETIGAQLCSSMTVSANHGSPIVYLDGSEVKLSSRQQ